MENEREEAHTDRSTGCVRIACVCGIVRVYLELQALAVLRLQQLPRDMDEHPGSRSQPRAGAARCDRAAEGRRQMDVVLQTGFQGRRIRRSSRVVCGEGL